MKTIREHLEEIWTLVNSDKTDFYKRTELVEKIVEIKNEGIDQMTESANKIIETNKTK
jgi:hypothetical protein